MEKFKECACGCKQLIPCIDKKGRIRKFIVGHVNNVRTYKPLSSYTKRKLSLALKGRLAWNKGIPCSKHVKDCVSRANTGRIASIKTRKKMSIARGGKNAYNWHGGIYKDKYGYTWIKYKNNKLNTYHGKYAKRCNVIWYEKTGEIIRPPFLLHHKNEDKNDDSFSNLKKMTRAEHINLHKKEWSKMIKPKGLNTRVYIEY